MHLRHLWITVRARPWAVDGHMSALVLGVGRVSWGSASLQRPRRSTRVCVRVVIGVVRRHLSADRGHPLSQR